MILVDTSAFFALAYPEDSQHERAKKILESCLENQATLVTHNYILVESFALFHRRLGFQTAKYFYKEVHQMCRVLWLTQTQHERAAKSNVQQTGSR